VAAPARLRLPRVRLPARRRPAVLLEEEELKPVQAADGRTHYVRRIISSGPDHVVAEDADGRIVRIQLR
jgi:hypothetical protein